MWVINFNLRLLYPRETTPLPIAKGAALAPEPVLTFWNILPLPRQICRWVEEGIVEILSHFIRRGSRIGSGRNWGRGKMWYILGVDNKDRYSAPRGRRPLLAFAEEAACWFPTAGWNILAKRKPLPFQRIEPWSYLWHGLFNGSRDRGVGGYVY